MIEPDAAALRRIAAILKLPAWAVEEFCRELAGLIVMARGAASISRRSLPKRSDVMARISAALAQLDDTEAGHVAAQILGCPVPATMRHRAQQVDDAIFARPGPRPGSVDRPELDFFLWAFLPLARNYDRWKEVDVLQPDLPRLTFGKDRNAEGIVAIGSLVECLKIVAPCFARGFLPDSDATLLRAIERATVACPTNQ